MEYTLACIYQVGLFFYICCCYFSDS